ncbi:MAG: TIGR03960 family B12-binding radical SAM protein [Candidatus Lindowbacteria bacterium]|nr:TIGR03960 family B12-binding radical SAM protein [Candidatus Lindowbacteria bacterium]
MSELKTEEAKKEGIWNSDWIDADSGASDMLDRRSGNAIDGLSKPGRYSGGEVNQVSKPGVSPAIALCFPDVYEIGMSHLGIKILYEEVNAREEFAAERVFSPWKDKASQLRADNEPLRSLETGRPLNEFDIIGFSISYELSYTDILEMLSLGGVPLRREDRGENDPIVIAGGHCAFHIAPMRPFLDGIFSGEADEAIVEIMEGCLDTKGDAYSRKDRLRRLVQVEGVHLFDVPRLTKPSRRVFYGFESTPGIKKPVVSNILSVQDRVSVEIMRGCTRGCRFCQAGYITRPQRYRPPELIEESAVEALRNSGYDEVSLISLSACDHPSMHEIASRLAKRLSPENIAISIPSTRVDAFDIELNNLTSSGRKTGITMAPEVSNERMDRIINKGSDPVKLRENVKAAFENGWKTIKLYYIIGNPFETVEDAADIGRQLTELQPFARAVGGRIRVSVNVLCPKPWTPFQWMGMEKVETLTEKVTAVRRAAPFKNIELNISDPESTLVEAALARGGEELSAVIEEAMQRGLTLQSWGEHFDLKAWKAVFESQGRSLHEDAYREYDLDEKLPWDDLDIGIDKNFLLREWKATENAANDMGRYKTEDCSTGACYNCGQPCVGTHPSVPGGICAECDMDTEPLFVDRTDFTAESRKTFSFTFSRKGPSLLLGQLDVMRAFERSLRRARIPIAMSQGFNPRAKLSFALALPLGIASESEYAEITLFDIEPEDFVVRLNPVLPEGLRIEKAWKKDPKVSMQVKKSRYRLKTSNPEEIMSILDENMSKEHVKFKRRKKTVKILGDYLEDVALIENGIELSLVHSKAGTFPISEIVPLFKQIDPNCVATRVKVELENR